MHPNAKTKSYFEATVHLMLKNNFKCNFQKIRFFCNAKEAEIIKIIYNRVTCSWSENNLDNNVIEKRCHYPSLAAVAKKHL